MAIFSPASFFVSLLLGILISVLAWRLDYFHPLPTKERCRFGLGEVVGAFFIFIFIAVAIIPAIVTLWYWSTTGDLPENGQFHVTPSEEGWFNIVAILLTTGGLLLYTSFLNQAKQADVYGLRAFQPLSIPRDIFIGILTWPIAAPWVVALGQVVTLLTGIFFEPHPVDQVAVLQVKAAMENPLLFAAMVLSIILIVPLAEEILFRGFLQRWLSDLLSPRWAIVIASAIFALFHFSVTQGIGNIELLSSLFLLSLYLGYLYERQQSLWAPVALHATFNGLSILMIVME